MFCMLEVADSVLGVSREKVQVAGDGEDSGKANTHQKSAGERNT